MLAIHKKVQRNPVMFLAVGHEPEPGEGNAEIFERCLYLHINLCHFRSPFSFSPFHKLNSTCDSLVVFASFKNLFPHCFLMLYWEFAHSAFMLHLSKHLFCGFDLSLLLGDPCNICIFFASSFCLSHRMITPVLKQRHD